MKEEILHYLHKLDLDTRAAGLGRIAVYGSTQKIGQYWERQVILTVADQVLYRKVHSQPEPTDERDIWFLVNALLAEEQKVPIQINLLQTARMGHTLQRLSYDNMRRSSPHNILYPVQRVPVWTKTLY